MIYTGVAGHSYEAANPSQIKSQAHELGHEGGGHWNGVGGYFRNSPGYYGYSERQYHGVGHNAPYHYHAPSRHYAQHNFGDFWGMSHFFGVHQRHQQHDGHHHKRHGKH